jgi:hypothetical protein
MRGFSAQAAAKVLVKPESSAPSLVYCQQAKDLLDALAAAIHELVNVHQKQFESLIGDDESLGFDDLIHRANELKREAKYAYLLHLETHGCSTYPTPAG